MIEAVVFDWGGTLTTYVHVDPAEVWSAAARCLAPAEEETVRDALWRAEATLWRAVEHDARSGSLLPLMETVGANLGLPFTRSLLEEARDCYLRAWTPYVRHRADASDALQALRDRGLKVGLLSNTIWPAAFHDDLLARDGLKDLIDVRHYTSERARMKPHPTAFAAVLDELGVTEPRVAVFVGDRLFDDIFGAQRAGLRAVHLANEFVPAYDVEPDARIESLAELVDLVDGWAT